MEVGHACCVHGAKYAGNGRHEQTGYGLVSTGRVCIDASIQLGMFKMTVPPMSSAMICTASPTDLSCVVLVVLKPRSRMMIVENELTTPFGMALGKHVSAQQYKG